MRLANHGHWLGFVAALLVLGACRTQTPMPAAADLEADLRAIAARYPDATLAVALRDPQTGTMLDLNGDRSFHAASTMKVPVMIEVFRQAEAGQFSLDDPLLVKNEFRSMVDGSPFAIEDDSDDAIYAHLGETMTVRDLVYQMITVSSNLATNLLIDFIAADSVQATMERLGTRHMKVRRGVEDILAFRQGRNNTTTATDLALVMDALRRGDLLSEASHRAMLDILLDQQFNSMIPAGLPEGTRVAHKTGSITRIHHDAALIYPEAGAPYVLVVLTEGIDDHAVSAALGAEITRTVHGRLRP